MTSPILKAGLARTDVTPNKSLFLYGYPHIERYSQDVHDPLYASALILDNGQIQLVFCAVDILLISNYITKKVRELVKQRCAIPKENIMISATHTHSGPGVRDGISQRYDPIVPPPDKEYVESLIERTVQTIMEAYNNKIECELGLTIADGKGVGGNRRQKDGAIDPEVPVMVLRKKEDKQIYGLLSVYCMHPTVLHEDNKLYSSDFPGYVREYLLNKISPDVVYLYHTGPEGNQSPRHYVKGATFDEAKRLGYMLGERIFNKIEELTDEDYKSWVELDTDFHKIDLPLKRFPNLKEAGEKLKSSIEKLKCLRKNNAPYSEVRTAECDWFGAERAAALARLAGEGELADIIRTIMPAEIQVFKIDNNYFVALSGESFVEYSLAIKEGTGHKVFVIALANGELQSYIISQQAYNEGGYEVSTSLFKPEAGNFMVNEALARLSENQGSEMRNSLWCK